MSVYILTCRDLNIAKIGYSADPIRRAASLKTGLPTKCALEAVIPASRQNETELHGHFASQRKGGEWFNLCPEIEDLIAYFQCGNKKRKRAEGTTVFGQYCDAEQITSAEFAKVIGKHVSLVCRWRHGKVRPTLNDAFKIEAATNGRVSVKSWLSKPQAAA